MKLIPAPTAPWGEMSDWLTVEGESGVRIQTSALVYGNAQVSGDARVYGNALVSGSARVSGNAQVYGSRDYLTIGPLGTRFDTLTLHRDTMIGVRVNTGCFSGTVDEFMARLTEHPEHKLYAAIIPALHAGLVARMTPLDPEAHGSGAENGQ